MRSFSKKIQPVELRYSNEQVSFFLEGQNGRVQAKNLV